MGPPFPGKWTFRYHPWLREMHDCKAELIVGQKSAQMGFTECALNLTFFAIDVRGQNVLYVLPNKTPDATDFTNARFAPALDLSEHLKKLFTDINNVGHKRAGNANLYVRGSKSKPGLRSIPVQVIILDEVDVMEQENIPLALERVSGQPTKSIFLLSTPTIQRYGINSYFEQSDQRRFFFPCPSCSRSINLEFPRNLEITGDDPYSPELKQTRLLCHLCKAELQHSQKATFLQKGVWVPARTSDAAGFHINQLYSSTIKPVDLARKYLRGLQNQADEQEFFNSALGLPHHTAGSRVTDDHIIACTQAYKMQSGVAQHNNFITMGVDVGRRLHIEICDWYWEDTPEGLRTQARLIYAGTRDEFEELDRIIDDFAVQHTVIDMNPERRKARDFVERMGGNAEMCEYPFAGHGREIVSFDDEKRIQVDRTAWLDRSLGRLVKKTIFLPEDLPYEYREQVKALTRVYYRDREGNVRSRYIKGSDEDHFAHARNYCEVAFARAIVRGGNRSAENPLYG